MRINTDSPWPWLLLFSAMALAGLAVIGPKHVLREERRVRMQGARETRGQLETSQPGEVETEELDLPGGNRRTYVLLFFASLLWIAGVTAWSIAKRSGIAAHQHPAEANGPGS